MGASNGDRKMHWTRWDRLTREKKEGGFGFRELEAFNTALLAKMASRILDEPDSLWVKVLKVL